MLGPQQALFVTGGLPQLGAWQSDQMLPLTGQGCVWELLVLPRRSWDVGHSSDYWLRCRGGGAEAVRLRGTGMPGSTGHVIHERGPHLHRCLPASAPTARRGGGHVVGG